jgi:hypothetical protein
MSLQPSRVAALEKKLRSKARPQEGLVDRMLADCFPEQRVFVVDPSPQKAADTTRRAGKSYSDGLIQCISALENPGTMHLYVHLFREDAKDTYWTAVLKEIDSKYGLNIDFNDTSLEARFPNGSVIKLKGYDTEPDAFRKVLGKKYKTVVVDESGSFRQDLEEALNKYVGPALVDLAGQLILSSMPTNFTKSYFARVRAGKVPGWSVHHWDAHKNTSLVEGVPMCQRWAESIARLRANDPHVEEQAWFQQQYLGMWVVDTTNLCYHFREDRNVYQGLPVYPTGSWTYVLGCDLGFNDATAFVVGAYHDHDPNLYIVEAYKKPGLDYTAVAEHIQALDKKYNGFAKMMVDGANKQGVEEMRRRHSLPLVASEKQDKATFMGLLDSDLIAGRVKADPKTCPALIQEWSELVWYERALEQNKRVEHPSLDNHLCDAALYMHRYAYQWLSRPIDMKLVPGTPEWRQKRFADYNQEPEMTSVPEPVEDLTTEDFWGASEDSWG